MRLAARLVGPALAVALAACAGAVPRSSPPTPVALDVRLGSAPARVTEVCRTLAASLKVPVLCPSRLPGRLWAVNHRTLRDGRCAYLLDVVTRPFGQSVPFHALAGGRCGPWPLSSRRGLWPVSADVTNDLGLVGSAPLRPGQPGSTKPTPVRARVLAAIRVGGRPGLLLAAAAYPAGGVHGGHIAAIWNRGAFGYVLSLHFSDDRSTPAAAEQRAVVATAAGMAP